MSELLEGVTLKMGGQDWTVPPLTLGQLKRLLPKIKAMDVAGDALEPAAMDAAAVVVQAALSRNYPDITVEQVEELLDLRNFHAVVQAIMGVSGLVKTGEA